MSNEKKDDPFLDKRVVKYDEWLSSGKISFSSKVIPVSESFKTEQAVLPTEQVTDILRSAKSVALQKCLCRTHYRRCDKPLEVCFVLNEAADRYVAKGLARYVSFDEAVEVLGKANESGLVHLTLYMPDHQVFALCSCCSCCCHDLQIVKLYGRKDLLVRSDYVAVTDPETCTDCGECIERCVFGARMLQDGKLHFNVGACLGCGLCVTVCPVGATTMKLLTNHDR